MKLAVLLAGTVTILPDVLVEFGKHMTGGDVVMHAGK